jgi:hypothetical protein
MARRRPAEPTANVTRGAILVIAAVVVGLFLLRNGLDTSETVRASDSDDSGEDASGDGGSDANGEASDETTTTTVATRPPAEVPVIVLNGTATSGVAKRISDPLAAAGYQTEPPGNATADVEATQVLFAPGFEAEAAVIATAIGAPAGAVQPLPATPPGNVGGAQVVVVVGPDLAAG